MPSDREVMIEQLESEPFKSNWEKYHIRYNVGRHRMNEFMPMMMELVKLFRPHTYVELGLRHGYTMNHITSLDIVERVVGVEIDEKRLVGVKRRRGVELFNMSTDEFSEQWEDPIDMLFIDADHDVNQVLKDFNNLAPYVSVCGFILMHDAYPPGRRTNVYSSAWVASKRIHELPEYKDYEIFTFPGCHEGLSIVRKVPKHYLHWVTDKMMKAVPS